MRGGPELADVDPGGRRLPERPNLGFLTIDETTDTIELVYVTDALLGQGLATALLEFAREGTAKPDKSLSSRRTDRRVPEPGDGSGTSST